MRSSNPTIFFSEEQLVFEKFNPDDLLEQIKLKVVIIVSEVVRAIKATELETLNPDDLLEIKLKVVIIVSAEEVLKECCLL